jgi:hypothetical protein
LPWLLGQSTNMDYQTKAKETLSRDLARRRAQRNVSLSNSERSVFPEDVKSETTAQTKTAPADTTMTDAPSSSTKKEGVSAKSQGKAGSPSHPGDLPALEISDLDRTKMGSTGQSEHLSKGSRTEPDPSTTSAAKPTDETPATAGLNKMNFDSIFPEGAGEDGAPDLAFDLDFPTDAVGEQHLLGEDFALAGNIQSTAPPITGLPTDSLNDDFGSLLPDLGEYGTLNDGDLSMLDMQIGTTSTGEAGQSQTARNEAVSIDNAGGTTDLLQSDSNFDNLFLDSTEFDLGTGDGTGTLGEGGEFDDAFFGLGDS